MIDPTKKELNHVATDFFLASVQAWQDSVCFYSPFLKHSAYIQGSKLHIAVRKIRNNYSEPLEVTLKNNA